MRALRAIFALFLLIGWVSVAQAASSPRYHTIASGQRLGSIAKRYGVSVEALCTANGIERNGRLKVGQKLLVPSRDDKDGRIARRLHGPPEDKDSGDAGTRRRSGNQLLARAAEPEKPQTHKVYAGQRLETIARRYQVSIEALCEVNRIRRTDKLKLGQILVIPGALPERSVGLTPASLTDLEPKNPRKVGKRGQVDFATYTARYRGTVFDKRGKVSPAAIAAISKLFGATGKNPRVDARLIALLADVSDHFGGRPFRIVSGYRDHSYYDDSRHKHSQAVDFSIPGVSNTVLRDYLRRFRNVGVGYYPNSTFVHLDVREGAAYWVDYAGPGEAPRSRPRREHQETLLAKDTSGASEAADTQPGAAAPPVETAPAAATTAADEPKSDMTTGASRVVQPTQSPSL